ncbi:potassium channel family protein [Aestuariirhabdus litorea]|uniref:potassium channel family protein n=1 Tax=Aestuariirhabdus litorea TaxID=2528527 RepID=UPI000F61DCEE|nr:potassium channel family protein [Aestuariirhabdus litorea]RWW97434.1 potassium channel protein [Endozoicomonadaceae bacterium GTF-13]
MAKWLVFPRYGFGSMAAGIVCILAMATLSGSSFLDHFLIRLSISVLLIASVYLLSRSPKQLLVSVLLGLPTMVTNWAVLVMSNEWLVLADHLTNVLFFTYVTWCLLQQVFSSGQVSGDTIWGSICIYLLIGFIWSFIFGALSVLQPHALTHISADQVSSLVYFSFVTLSTLGYGDITPVTRQAQMLAFSEALMGQLYLTVLVARLVGLYHTSGKG